MRWTTSWDTAGWTRTRMSRTMRSIKRGICRDILQFVALLLLIATLVAMLFMDGSVR